MFETRGEIRRSLRLRLLWEGYAEGYREVRAKLRPRMERAGVSPEQIAEILDDDSDLRERMASAGLSFEAIDDILAGQRIGGWRWWLRSLLLGRPIA